VLSWRYALDVGSVLDIVPDSHLFDGVDGRGKVISHEVGAESR